MKRVQYAIFLLTFFLLGSLTAIKSNDIVYNEGYNKALDTVQKIMDRQIRDTTIVSKVKFQTKKDTLTYILLNK